MIRRWVTIIILVWSGGAGAWAEDGPDPSWLERLDPEDRACLERGVGYAPPAFTNDLMWFNTDPLTWSDLRKKVVVIQSWSSRTASGRNWAMRGGRTFADQPGVQLIALHTPPGAGDAPAFLDRRRLELPVVIDRRGSFCNVLGVYERPVNIVIDRNGTVRYAGLNQRGLKKAVARLLTEPYDPNAIGSLRPVADEKPAVEFPSWSGQIRQANDLRGRRAPPLSATQWLNGRPDTAGKVVVIDFWATWFGPCRTSIPHVNTLADQFRDDVVFIGLSDETRDRFVRNLTRYDLSAESFRYFLALDPRRRMQQAIELRTIPHAIVMSSDGIVRWQGRPTSLTASTLARIVDANRGLQGGGPVACQRWAVQ